MSSTVIPALPGRLGVNMYETDDGNSHISVDQDKVRQRGCGGDLIRVCPAHVYSQNTDGTIGIEYAACLECGTCRALFPDVVQWHYPAGGMGVVYREG